MFSLWIWDSYFCLDFKRSVVVLRRDYYSERLFRI